MPARKNRTNLVVNWPSRDTYFTIKQLHAINPQFVLITLTVRVDKAVNITNSVACIGTYKGPIGAPSKVYAMTPVSQKVITLARDNGVEIVGSSELVRLLEIRDPQLTKVVNVSSVGIPVNNNNPSVVSNK